MTLDFILRTKPTFLADVPHHVFENTVGFSRFKFGPDTIVKPPAPKYKIFEGKVIRLRDEEDEGVRPNPKVQRACQRLRDLRLFVGTALYTHRERQHESHGRRAKRELKKNARMRRKGLEVLYPSNQPSPLKQAWTQRTIMDVFDNTDPWTAEPGESVLYSDYRPASSDDDADDYDLVRWDDIAIDPVLLLDDGFCVEAMQVKTPATALEKKSEKEEGPQQLCEESHFTPNFGEFLDFSDLDFGAEMHVPQVAPVGKPLDSHITPPSSQTELPPVGPSPQRNSTPSPKKRKASEDLHESPTKRLRASLAGHEPAKQTTSALSEQSQRESSPNTPSPPRSASPRSTFVTPSPKKRKASEDLDGKSAKRQRDSAEIGKQSVLPAVVSSGDRLGSLANSPPTLNSPTLDEQCKEKDVEQSTSPSLNGRFTDASPARSSLTKIHQPDRNLSRADTTSAISRVPDQSLTSAHPLPTTEVSPVNSCGNQQTGKAPPSRIWFRNGWSCNLH